MGEPFIDPGVNVTDFSGADQSGTAKLINPPDTATPGTYTLTYTGNDFRGFESAVNRTVQVIVTPPVITLNSGTHARDSADGSVVYHSVSSKIETRTRTQNKVIPISSDAFPHDFGGQALSI